MFILMQYTSLGESTVVSHRCRFSDYVYNNGAQYLYCTMIPNCCFYYRILYRNTPIVFRPGTIVVKVDITFFSVTS